MARERVTPSAAVPQSQITIEMTAAMHALYLKAHRHWQEYLSAFNELSWSDADFLVDAVTSRGETSKIYKGRFNRL